MDIPGVKIIRELGRGATAVVYLGEQLSLQRPVAIKVLNQQSEAGARSVDRFMREARIIAALHHPAIVDIYDFGETGDGDLYYVMPYLDNGDLRDLEWSSDEDLVEKLIPVCDALYHAHNEGVIHRDLKPENLLLGRGQVLRLADFGIAYSHKTDKRLTKDGLTVGSVWYMSPEQARGRKVDQRSDIYSFGALLFELLAERVPFDAEDDLGVLLAHLNDPIPRLPAERRHWQPIIDRCMAKSPGDRYPNALALREALAQMGRTGGGPAAPRLGRLIPPTPWLVGGSLVALVLAMAIIIATGGDDVRIVTEFPSADPATESRARGADSDIKVPSAAEYDQRLSNAHRHLAAGRLIQPPGDNAFDEIATLLQWDSDNPEAVAALEQLLDRLAAEIDRSLASGDLPGARHHFEAIDATVRRGWMSAEQTEAITAPYRGNYRASIAAMVSGKTTDQAESYRELADQLGLDPAALDQPAGVSSDGVAMVLVPSDLRRPDGSIHRIDAPFAMAIHEVTVAEFRRFATDRGIAPSECRNPAQPFRNLSWRDPGMSQADDHPVVCVSWRDASEYAAWLSERSRYRYRLPTEKEWHHAAWIGDVGDTACETGNVAGAEHGDGLFGDRFSCSDGHRGTAPVGSFEPNRLGIYDLRGNVREWTADCAERPSRAREILGRIGISEADPCDRRVVRGTSWWDDKNRSMLGSREYVADDLGYTNIGFRLVRDVD